MAVTFKQTQAQDGQPRDGSTLVGVTPAARPHGGNAPAPKAKSKRKPARKTMPKGKRGPKPKYDRAVFDRIFSEMAKGKTVIEILAGDSTYPSDATFYRVKAADPELQAEFLIAQQLQCDYLAHEIRTLSRDVKPGDVIVSKNGKTQSSYHRDRLTQARDQANNNKWLLSKIDPRYKEQSAQQITHSGSVDGVRRVIITGALPDEPLGDYSDADAEKLLADTARNYEFKPAYPGGNPRRIDSKEADIVVTGGLPRVPLGELPEAERAAAIAAARKTRVVTRESIRNPFNIDVNAVEAEDARMEAADEAEIEAAAREPGQGDLAVLARMSINPADYDGDA
jgi:hypothetical protein